MERQSVEVVFKIHDLPLAIREGLKKEDSVYKVGIIGSVPELSMWQSHMMITAEQCDTDEDVWKVTSQLPMSTTVTWIWMVTVNGEVQYLDNAGTRDIELTFFNGTAVATWGVTETNILFQRSEIRLRVHYRCQPDEVLAVVGSQPSLGSWNPRDAVRAKEAPANNWIARVFLDTNLDKHEWKWVVLNAETGCVKRWEEGSNRSFEADIGRLQMMFTKWDDADVVRYVRVVNNNLLPPQRIPIDWMSHAKCFESQFEANQRLVLENEPITKKRKILDKHRDDVNHFPLKSDRTKRNC